ncbi:MAG TPA: HAD-IIIA family hydrolase [Acidisarcina sp.]
MNAVILAGGRGTRLAARTGGLPKPLVEVNGRPLLAYQLELLKKHGVDQVTLLCGFGAAAVRDFCGDGSRWSLHLRCIEEQQALGTAGAVIDALPQLPESFLVLYGDTMLNVDLRRLNNAHLASGAEATLFLHPNDHPEDSDLVETGEDGFVTAIHPCPHADLSALPNQVNAALYVVNAAALRGFDVSSGELKLARSAGPLDFAHDVFPSLLGSGARLYGYRSPEYIKDAGTPERLDRVAADVASGLVARSSLDVPRPAVFLDRDGTINEEVGHLSRPGQFRLILGAAEGIRLLRDAGYRIAVITNQPVIARGDCTAAGLAQIHNAMEMQLSREHAFVDGIFHCPHHPDRGFEGEVPELKFDCECRKPKLGLVERAVRELNIDLRGSWLIGDRTSDIELARRAGIRSILVKTGAAGGDGAYSAVPALTFATLLDAASFLAERADFPNQQG